MRCGGVKMTDVKAAGVKAPGLGLMPERRPGVKAGTLLAAGLLWSLVFPVNKKLWTITFVLVVGAISLAVYALIYYIVEVRGHVKWTFPFRVVGMNSITIYLLQCIVPLRSVSNFFLGGAAGYLPEGWGAVLLSAGYLVVSWLVLYFLYVKKTFLKV